MDNGTLSLKDMCQGIMDVTMLAFCILFWKKKPTHTIVYELKMSVHTREKRKLYYISL